MLYAFVESLNYFKKIIKQNSIHENRDLQLYRKYSTKQIPQKKTTKQRTVNRQIFLS